MSLLKTIAEHAEAGRTRRIEVPEWGSPGEPLVITYSMVTLDDLSMVSELDGQEWNKRAARVVALKACDVDGNKLFAIGDAIEIRRTAAPEVVNRIAMQMLARTSIETAEKN